MPKQLNSAQVTSSDWLDAKNLDGYKLHVFDQSVFLNLSVGLNIGSIYLDLHNSVAYLGI